MPPLTKLESIILGRLATQPTAGYDLRKWLTKEGPYFGYNPQPSQIYRQLAKCEQRGWVTQETEPRRGAPDAKVYRLTPLGIERFRAWVDSEHVPSVRPLDADFQLRMLLTGVVGPRETLEVLRAELEFRREQQAHSEAYLDEADSTTAAIPIDDAWHHELVRLVGERSYLLGQTNLTWLEMAYARVAAMVADSPATPRTTEEN